MYLFNFAASSSPQPSFSTGPPTQSQGVDSTHTLLHKHFRKHTPPTSTLRTLRPLRYPNRNPPKQHKNTRKKALLTHINTLVHNNAIVNLTNTPLTPSQCKVLQKGLKFVPTPSPPSLKCIKQSFSQFKRRLFLRYHFRHIPRSPPPFRNPSTWDPPLPDNFNLRIFVNTLWDHITPQISYPKHPNRSNLSPNDQQALTQLQQLTHTIIKPADKGGSIVLWPEDQYIQEAYRQLLDPKYYIPIPHNPIPNLVDDITTYLHSLHSANIIDTATYKFLTPHSPSRIPLFYMLPKIHKPTIPGRPIISGCDSPTEKLSIFVDHYLKTLVPLTPSYIKDTNHFLQQIFTLPTPLPHNTLLVTLDVVSLYTNIPHEEGIAASLEALSTLPSDSTPPLQVFHRFLTFTLKHNFFSFNNQFYLQLQGTAMGTRMAPSYANIFMAKLESQLLKHSPNRHLPLLWKRFIDDIFMSTRPTSTGTIPAVHQHVSPQHQISTLLFNNTYQLFRHHNTHNTRTYTILNSLH